MRIDLDKNQKKYYEEHIYITMFRATSILTSIALGLAGCQSTPRFQADQVVSSV
jgi:hypothetical protein